MAVSTTAITLTTTPQKITNDFTGRDGCTLYISNPSAHEAAKGYKLVQAGKEPLRVFS
jgi:hypothetical protein